MGVSVTKYHCTDHYTLGSFQKLLIDQEQRLEKFFR